MITLITGLPGNGKTLYALWYVEKLRQKEDRPVFYARIKGVTRPWTQIDAFDWAKCPPKSIVVIDECQQSNDPENPKAPTLFGVRQRGSVVPPWAAALETHRHAGIDLVLITQQPSLLDSHDRALCELHFHVVRSFGMQRAVVHEFRPVRDNAAKSRKGSIEHQWSYPKEVYGWYQSAEAHTHKARVPTKVWVLCGLIVALPLFAWWLWAWRLDPRLKQPVPVAQTGTASGAPPVSAGAGGSGGGKLTRAQYLDAQTPRVQELAYTAPVYDDLTKPVTAPYPAACISSATRCKCYTQQATVLAVSDQLCRQIADGGFFVAWKSDGGRVDLRPATVVEPRREERPAMGGFATERTRWDGAASAGGAAASTGRGGPAAGVSTPGVITR